MMMMVAMLVMIAAAVAVVVVMKATEILRIIMTTNPTLTFFVLMTMVTVYGRLDQKTRYLL